MISSEKIQQFIAKAIPLTIYLESVSLLIATRGFAEIKYTSSYLDLSLVTTCYYMQLGSVYGLQIARVLLTKFLKGYTRGFWIHTATIVQFGVQAVLMISALVYLNWLFNSNWILWQLVLFILTFGSTMALRLAFILLISLRIFRNKDKYRILKETYWLSISTKEELFENQGRLCHDIQAAFEDYQKSMLDTENPYE